MRHFWRGRIVPLCTVPLALLLLLSLTGCFESESDSDTPRLRPVRAELPPTFWESHAFTVILYSAEVVALVGFVAWLFSRPVTPVAVPIEVQIRRELEVLRQRPDAETTLSEVSRCLRSYLAVAFGLPPGELTTAEFTRALTTNEAIGVALADRVATFLQRCDIAKFSPAQYISPTACIAEALEIVAQGETRREELRRAQAAKTTA